MLGQRWESTWRHWFNAGAVGKGPDKPVELGDRFFTRNRTGHTWVVDRIFVPPTEEMRHVAMHRADLEGERMMVAETMLTDERRFLPDRRVTQIGDPVTFARRRFDRPMGNVRSTV